jgi:uncharacterized protein YutE (UPF0331/DUF86 family)
MNHFKTNEKFLEKFISVESRLAKKLGINTAGVTDYINRLTNAKAAPNRDETLSQLIRFRTLRNRLVHQDGALRTLSEISKADVKWLTKFEKEVKKDRDPLSLHGKKAKSTRRRKLFLALLVLALFIVAVVSTLAAAGII